MRAKGTPLKDWDIAINYGIKTGFNDAFIINNQTKEAAKVASSRTVVPQQIELQGPSDHQASQSAWAPMSGKDIQRSAQLLRISFAFLGVKKLRLPQASCGSRA